MSIAWRSVALFATGVAVGAVGAGWAVYENADALHAAAKPERPAMASMRQEAPCPGAITLPASRDDDARFQLVDADKDHKPSDVGAFIVIGKEAAAWGRSRDAELAFIMACRVASKPGTDVLLLADAKYQLARHFAENARGRDGPQAQDLRRRARVLYGDSLRIYAVRLGDQHEKAVFAANGLAALDTSAPANVAVNVPAVSRGSDTRVAGAVAAPPARARPSFDCAKANSRTERLICGDAQLSQLDHDLGQLHARAKAVAPNAADFRRRSDAAWKQREQSCRDRDCLLAWYAQRRTQLLDEIDAQQARRHASTRSRRAATRRRARSATRLLRAGP